MEEKSEQDKVMFKLLRMIKSQKIALIAGAGISMSIGGPSGPNLARKIAEQFGVAQNNNDIRDITQDILDLRKATREQIEELIREELKNLHPDEQILELCSLPWAACFTTNYDLVLKEGLRHHKRNLDLVKEDEPRVNVLNPTKIFLFHIMGIMDEHADRNGRMILTHYDFNNALTRRRKYFDLLTEVIREGSAIFIGYSFKDRIVLDILRDIEERHGPDSLPPLYALFGDKFDEGSDHYQKLIAKNVKPIVCDMSTFIKFIKSNWDSIEDVPVFSRTIPLKVNEKIVNVEVGALVDLGPYIELLYEKPIREEPAISLENFLRGETDSWLPYKKEWEFKRDARNKDNFSLKQRVELEIRNTESKNNKILVLLGDDGSGKTTLVKRIAFDLAFKKELPTFLINDLGFSSKNIFFDSLLEKILMQYSDQVEDTGKGEEVKFIFIIDNASRNAQGAIRLFNFLTGNGRPLLMILVDRGEDLKDLFPNPEAYSNLINKKNIFILPDELNDDEIALSAIYLIKSGFWDFESERLIEIIKKDYGRSLFSTLYSLIEPSRPPLTQIAQDQFLELSEKGKQLYLSVAILHQFGFEPPFELIRRTVPIPPIELVDIFNTYPGSQLLVLRETDSGLDIIRTRHRILSFKIIDIFKPNYEEQVEILEKIVACANFASETERDFLVSFLVGTFGHKKESPFSIEQRIHLFRTAIQTNEDQVLLHHLALLEKRNGNIAIAKELIECALERGRKYSVNEELSEHLQTTLIGIVADEAIQQLKIGNIGKGELLIEEARGIFNKIQLSTRDIGYAFHREALMEYRLAEFYADSEKKEQQLTTALSLIERGLDSTQDEETIVFLFDLQSRVLADLGLTIEKNQSIEDLISAANNCDSVFAVSSCLRRHAFIENSTDIRRRLLEIANERIKIALRAKPTDSKLLREVVFVTQALEPNKSDEILNKIISYRSQEPHPSPIILFYGGVSAFQMGYFQKSKEYFAELNTISQGHRDRSKILAIFKDENGSVVKFSGVVAIVYNPKFAQLEITGPFAKGQTIGFAPIGFPKRIEKGQMYEFEIVFSFRGPMARLKKQLE